MHHGETLSAWLPFHDCHVAIDRLEQATEESSWRVDYVAALTLLRSVGHVLANVDAAKNHVLKAHLSEVWAEVSTNREHYKLFWSFIKVERDRALKEYEFRVAGFDAADPAILRFGSDGAIHAWPDQAQTLYLSSGLDELSSCSLPIDAAGLMREAAGFWFELLTELEFYLLPCDNADQCPF